MLHIIKNIVQLLTENIYSLFASTSFLSCTICLLLLFVILKKLNILSTTFNSFKILISILIYNIFYIIVFFGSLYLMDKIVL